VIFNEKKVRNNFKRPKNKKLKTLKIKDMKRRFFQLSMILLVSALFGLTACQENSDNVEASKGRLVVKLTDAPFPIDLIDQALVTIDKIEIRKACDSLSNEEQEGLSPFIVLSQETQQFNLLDLRNGITADLLSMTIDTGKYDLIRLHVTETQMILKDGTTFKLKVPGNGIKIKINPELVVEGGITSEVLMDFDVSKSFAIQGNIKAKHGIKGFTFRPVLRAVCEQKSSGISGKVVDTTGAPLAEASVELLQGDSVVTSSLTNEAGEYTMIGIPVGTYQMVCGKEGFSSSDATDVEVVLKHKTIQNFELAAADTTVQVNN
jgi:RNase P/RNase MRP subunit p29